MVTDGDGCRLWGCPSANSFKMVARTRHLFGTLQNRWTGNLDLSFKPRTGYLRWVGSELNMALPGNRMKQVSPKVPWVYHNSYIFLPFQQPFGGARTLSFACGGSERMGRPWHVLQPRKKDKIYKKDHGKAVLSFFIFFGITVTVTV